MRSHIGRIYQNFDLNVTMGELRSIDVFVVGQVSRPGRYTVSSLSTLTNAIFASGGPSPHGSMREIQLKRGGKFVTDVRPLRSVAEGRQEQRRGAAAGRRHLCFAAAVPRSPWVGRSTCRQFTNSRQKPSSRMLSGWPAVFPTLPTAARCISSTSWITGYVVSRKFHWTQRAWPIR